VSESPVAAGRTVGQDTNRGVLLAGTALASFGSLLLELALTRLFSVVLYYHFAFLAISLAMLGLGAGGVFSYLQRDWMVRWNLRKLASTICALNAGAILFSLWIALHTPVLLRLELDNMLRLSAIYITASVPFFFTGLLFTLVFAREAKHVAILYSADLIGGAFACLAIVPLLNSLGAPNAVFFAALAMALAAGIWAETKPQRRISVAMVALFIALIAVNHSERRIDVVYAKGNEDGYLLDEFAQWNAISRVEVDSFDGLNKRASIDADASTLIVSADPQDPNTIPYVKRWAPSSAIPSLLRPTGKYAIIGPGGGIDVLAAVVGGSPDVTGIEINPLIADTIGRERYAGYNHHLYELPQVHIHVSEGRSWIRGSHEMFDVIQMTLVDTWASTSAGAFALSENNLYTVEAFREYFDHLKSDGMLAITRWEFPQPREALRVVSEAIETLRRSGTEDVRKNFIIVANRQPNQAGTQVTVLAKKTAFTINEERAILQQVQSNSALYPLYTPNVYGRPVKDSNCGASVPVANGNCIEPALVQLSATRMLPPETTEPFQQLISLPSGGVAEDVGTSPRTKFIHDYPFEISPVTDNAPFFFFTFKTSNVLHTLLGASGHGSIDWKNNLGLVVLGAVLIISIVAVSGFLVIPLALHKTAQKPQITPLLYFVAVGLGFIVVEVALIQRFMLFLGHPTYAMTVVVFLMLLSGGAGSFASKYWLKQTLRVRAVLGAIAGLVTLYAFLLHTVLGSLVAMPFPDKVLVSAMLLVPLGFLMGMPFPAGLREIAEQARAFSKASAATESNTIEWAWAMNAASSVLGSVLAILIALHFGLDATLGCAAGAYLAAAALTLLWRRPRVNEVSEVSMEEPAIEVCVEA
jgi:predicted membrane-bound spermidine synthase